MRYGKIIRSAAWLLGGIIFLYLAANVALGLWGFPSEPLPSGCPDAASLSLPAPMPSPDLIFAAQGGIETQSASKTAAPLAASPACPLIAVAVISNGAHTDFLLPAVLNAPGEASISWPAIFPVPPELTTQMANLYVYIGWGQREFYLATPSLSDVSPALLLKAALGGTAALHVEYAPAPYPGAFGDDCAMLWLSPAQYTHLAQFISRAVKYGADGRALRINAPGYTPYDAFYEASGLFSALNTCNTWTATALHAAGQPAPRWTTLPWFILHHLRPQ